MSLVAAAATTFGFDARASPGSRRRRRADSHSSRTAAARSATASRSRGRSSRIPGGTGALMEKLANERGAAAFERAVFTVAAVERRGARRRDDEIAFLPAHRLSALIKERKLTSTQAHATSISTRIKRLDPTLLCAVTIMEEQALRRGARGPTPRSRPGKYRGPLHGHSVRRQRSLLDERRAHHVGLDGFRESHHRRRRRGRRAAARRRRGADGEAGDGPVRARRPVVSRPHEQSVGHPARLERVVGRPGVGDRGGLRRVRHRHRDVGLDRVAGARVRTERAASDVRPREPLRRNGARVVAGSRRSDLPHDRRLRDGVQRDSRRRREGSVDRDDAVPIRSQHQALLGAHRRRRERAEGVRRQAARARRRSEADRPAAAARRAAAGCGAESAAAFDFYVQRRRRSSASISRRCRHAAVGAEAAAAAARVSAAAAGAAAAVAAARPRRSRRSDRWRRSRAAPAAASRARSTSFRRSAAAHPHLRRWRSC